MKLKTISYCSDFRSVHRIFFHPSIHTKDKYVFNIHFIQICVSVSQTNLLSTLSKEVTLTLIQYLLRNAFKHYYHRLIPIPFKKYSRQEIE